jgi:hypothetical protein
MKKILCLLLFLSASIGYGMNDPMEIYNNSVEQGSAPASLEKENDGAKYMQMCFRAISSPVMTTQVLSSEDLNTKKQAVTENRSASQNSDDSFGVKMEHVTTALQTIDLDAMD